MSRAITPEQKRRAVERAVKWATENPAKVRLSKRRYLEKNRYGKVLENKKRWQRENPEKANATSRRWSAKNPVNRLVRGARYRARFAAAIVPLTVEQQADIIALYAKARALTELVGESYHVDHIKPLSKGGLHHPDNLQILLGRDNLKKGSKYD